VYHRSNLYLFSLNSILLAVVKYSYAAVWSAGLWAPAGKCRYSLMAIVATLARPIPDRPVLMPHDDERYLSQRWDTFSMDKIFLVDGSREELQELVA
jgi:hypothetical protein